MDPLEEIKKLYYGATKATTNSVSVLGDLYGFGSGSVFMDVFDIDGNLIGNVSDTDDHPLGTD